MKESKTKVPEAIRIWVMKDGNVKSGVMWQVKAPLSLKERFDKKYPQGFFCSKDKALTEVLNEITRWKLSKLSE